MAKGLGQQSAAAETYCNASCVLGDRQQTLIAACKHVHPTELLSECCNTAELLRVTACATTLALDISCRAGCLHMYMMYSVEELST